MLKVQDSVIAANNYEGGRIEKGGEPGISVGQELSQDVPLTSYCGESLFSQSTGLYSMEMIRANARSASDNQQMQSALSGLGFYAGPIDGNMSSELSQKAIRNFQMVYGISANGTMDSNTLDILSSAISMRNSCLQDVNLTSMSSVLGLDSIEKDNFVNTWTFMRIGLGLTSQQAAGIAGNFYMESKFSCDNANNNPYPGDHNSDYVYSATDDVAYGIMQWKDSTEKQKLSNMSSQMGLSESKLNAQLAHFREEVTTGVYHRSWAELKSLSSYSDVARYFLVNMERTSENHAQERIDKAQTIYSYMGAH